MEISDEIFDVLGKGFYIVCQNEMKFGRLFSS